MLDLLSFSRTLIIKPTNACNFNCTFCSAKLLNIPLHNKLPEKLKQYILDYKPTNVIITGGEPLMNPRSYWEDLFNTLDETKVDYWVSITSNLVLWYNNPEEWDWLFTNPKVGVDTSFQYGEDRRDNQTYTEERFLDLFWKFYNRYKKKLDFITVVNKNNEKDAIKIVELAKKLDVWVKLNSQLPVGNAKEYYPRYKLLEIYLELFKRGLADHEGNLLNIEKKICPFMPSYKNCKALKVVYINEKDELVEGNCEEELSSQGKYKVEKGVLFSKCYACPMFNICNGCSLNRQSTEPVKEEHCKWMKAHYTELKEHDLI